MSIVTNLIICCSLLEDKDKITDEFEKYTHNGHPFGIVSVTNEKLPKDWYGGEKNLECIVFIGAYNHLDLDCFLGFMKTEMSWEAPDLVQIIVKEENDIKFRLIDLE